MSGHTSSLTPVDPSAGPGPSGLSFSRLVGIARRRANADTNNNSGQNTTNSQPSTSAGAGAIDLTDEDEDDLPATDVDGPLDLTANSSPVHPPTASASVTRDPRRRPPPPPPPRARVPSFGHPDGRGRRSSGVLELSSGGEDVEEDRPNADDDLIIIGQGEPLAPPPGHPLAPPERAPPRPRAQVRFDPPSLLARRDADTRDTARRNRAQRMAQFEAELGPGGGMYEASSGEEDLILGEFRPARPGEQPRAYYEDEAFARRLQAELAEEARLYQSERDIAAAAAAGVGGAAMRARMEGLFAHLAQGRGRDNWALAGMLGGFGGAQEFWGRGDVGIPPGLQGVIGRDAAWGGAAKVRASKKWTKALSYPRGGAKAEPGFSRDIVPPPDSDDERVPPPKKRKGAKTKKAPAPPPAQMDPVCASCLLPLVLDPNREERRPWVLACGHVVCGACLDLAKGRQRADEDAQKKANWRPAPIDGPAPNGQVKGKGRARAEVLTLDDDEDEPLTELETETDSEEDVPLAFAAGSAGTRAGSVGVTRRSQGGRSTRSGMHAPPVPKKKSDTRGERAKSQTPGIDQLRAANKAIKNGKVTASKGPLVAGKAKRGAKEEVGEPGVVDRWVVCPVAGCDGAGGRLSSVGRDGPWKLYF